VSLEGGQGWRERQPSNQGKGPNFVRLGLVRGNSWVLIEIVKSGLRLESIVG